MYIIIPILWFTVMLQSNFFPHYIYTPTNIYRYYIIYANVNGHNSHLLMSSLTVVKPFYAFSISQTPH